MALQGRETGPALPIPYLDRRIPAAGEEVTLVCAGDGQVHGVALLIVLGRGFEAFGESELTYDRVVRFETSRGGVKTANGSVGFRDAFHGGWSGGECTWVLPKKHIKK